jgi:hypothetical protein
MSRDLARYLAANPAMTPRDFKGKGFSRFQPFNPHYVGLNEPAWNTLDRGEVRRLAVREKARFLPRCVRMAAARDPGLIWCPRTRSYCIRDESAPASQEATGWTPDREGAKNVSRPSRPRPATASKTNANIICPRGRARDQQGQ